MRATRAIIDISALHHNQQIIKALAPKAEVMAVLKADAYGHGLLEVAKHMTDVACIGVACMQEAVILREGGVTTDIVLLEGFFDADELPAIIDYGFTIVVHHQAQIEALQNYQTDKSIPAWIKLDTGMHRLGFAPSEFAEAVAALEALPIIDSLGVMNHFACADDINSSKTSNQLKQMQQVLASLEHQNYPISCANSAAVLAWPESHYDLIRPGILLYGISPLSNHVGADHGLKPVMQLESEVIAIRTIEPGETVGYGANWQAEQATRIATVGIGYGDGYPRGIKPNTPVVINGKRYPIVGNVSMDMLTIDIGDQPIKVGDPVVLWGDELPVEEIARSVGTIAYELLCGITQRVPYEYV